MKKLITAIIAVLYLTITSGVVLDMHYCMNKLSSVKVQYHLDDVCGKCGMKAKDGCCKDELKLVKLSGEHKYVLSDFSFAFTAPVTETYVFPGINILPVQQQFTLGANGPPLSDVPLYLKNRVFRI